MMANVLIEIHGGVATVEEKSAGVTVTIRDYDIEGAEDLPEDAEYSETVYEEDDVINPEVADGTY